MSIMDFFRTAPTVAAPQQQPGQQQTQGQPQTPAQPAMEQQQQADPNAVAVDPMDAFKDLWAPAAKVEGAEEEFNPQAIFNIDPATMQAAIGKINFAEGVVTQQDLEAITAGGPEAMQAFMKALNGTGAKAMQMATTASAKMVEQAMTRASGAMDKKIASGVKLNQVSSSMQELNPALSHPAAAPMIEALKVQFTNKHPTASPAEITKLISSYMDGMSGIMAGKKEEVVDPAAARAAQGTDWDKYFKGE